MKRYFILLFIALILLPSIALGFNGAYDRYKVETWCQGTVPFARKPLNNGRGGSVGGNACGYFGYAYALLKAGAMERDGNYIETIVDIASQKNLCDNDWGHIDPARVEEVNPALKPVSKYLSFEGKSNEECFALIKKWYSEGKYIEVCVRANFTAGHYIFVDGFTEDGDMVIGDSGFLGTKWSDNYAKNGGSFMYANIWESTKGKPANKQPSIYGDSVGLAKVENVTSDKEVKIADSIISEWELVGMPIEPKFRKLQRNIPEFEELENTKDRVNVEAIKRNIYANKLTPKRTWDITKASVGGLLIFYANLMTVAYLIDLTQDILPIRFTSVLSFGNINKNTYDSNKDFTISILKVIILCFSVAVLLFNI